MNRLIKYLAIGLAYSVFLSFSASAQVFTNLLNFYGTNGSYPVGGLILSGKTLYGTTFEGGSQGYGTIFKINTNGSNFTILHNFNGGPDGSNPSGALVLFGNSLYGATYGNRSAGQLGNGLSGTIFTINIEGTGFTNLYTFTGGSDGAFPEDGLILSNGVLYGTTGGASGDAFYGTIFKMNIDGSGFTNLYTFSGGSGGEYPIGGLALAGNTLYGTAEEGGTGGSGTIFSIKNDGSGFTNIYNFSATAGQNTNSDGSDPRAPLILSGNMLYGTATEGGTTGLGSVFSINLDGTGFTNLHSFTGSLGDGDEPYGSLILSGGILFGTDVFGGSNYNGSIFAIGTNGTGFTNLYSFTADPGTNGDGGGPQGNIVLDNNSIYGTAINGGYEDLGTIYALNLSQSSENQSTQTTTLYVGNNGNQTIEQFTTNGIASLFATNSFSAFGIAVDSSGNVYAAYPSLNRIEKYSPNGADLGPFATSNLDYPQGIAFDSAGYLYVANETNIEKFTPSGVGSSFVSAGLDNPASLTIDRSNNLYVANIGYGYDFDSYIEKFTPNGAGSVFFTMSSTYAGYPSGLVCDSSTNLYVSFYPGSDVERFSVDGNDLGALSTTKVINPAGLAIDGAGNLYVACYYLNTIEEFSPMGVDLGTFASQNLDSPNQMAFSSASVPAAVLTNLTVNPANAVIASGSNFQFTATEQFSDGSYQIITNGGAGSFWSSTDTAVASINENGTALGLSAGVTTIIATSGSISGNAALTVVTTPAITSQSTNVTTGPGGNASFSVTATGGDLSYQWQLNGTNITGATGATLNLTNVTAGQAGIYTVVISNVAGTTTNSPEALSLLSLQVYAGLTIVGEVGGTYEIDYWNSLNSNYTPLTNIVLPASPYLFIDTNSPNFPERFYRATLLP